jgi:hypothetical protein
VFTSAGPKEHCTYGNLGLVHDQINSEKEAHYCSLSLSHPRSFPRQISILKTLENKFWERWVGEWGYERDRAIWAVSMTRSLVHGRKEVTCVAGGHGASVREAE